MSKIFSVVLLLVVAFMALQAIITVEPRIIHEEQKFFSDKDAACEYIKENMDQEDIAVIEVICGKYYIDGEIAWSVEIMK